MNRPLPYGSNFSAESRAAYQHLREPGRLPDEMYTVPPLPGQQLTKDQAGYVAHGPFTCKHCCWYTGGTAQTGECRVIGSDVNRDACCDAWNEQDALPNQGKQEAEYVYVKNSNYTCAECKFFDATTRTCWPVEGQILPGASCNKWTPV